MMKMNSKVTFSILLAVVIAAAACGPNDRIMRSAEDKETPAAVSADQGEKISDQNSEIAAMLTAELKFVFSIERRDGGVFESGDRNVIRVNTSDANRRVVDSNDKWVVIGTNNKLRDENMKVLNERFIIKDYSLPESTDKKMTPEGQ